MGSRTQGVQEILKIWDVLTPHKSEMRDGTHGAGPLIVVLHSNSFADNF